MTVAMTHLRVLAHRGRLDRALADGADPHADEQLELRAAQLERRASRDRLAKGLERVLAAAETPAVSFSAAAPLDRGAIRAARPLLTAVTRELRGDAPVRAQGVALAGRLVVDGNGPLYRPSVPAELVEAVGEVTDALSPPGPALRMTA